MENATLMTERGRSVLSALAGVLTDIEAIKARRAKRGKQLLELERKARAGCQISRRTLAVLTEEEIHESRADIVGTEAGNLAVLERLRRRLSIELG